MPYRPIFPPDLLAVLTEAINELSEGLQEHGNVPMQPAVYDRIVRSVAFELDSLGDCTYLDAIHIIEGVWQYMTRWFYTAAPKTLVSRDTGGLLSEVARFQVERWPPVS